MNPERTAEFQSLINFANNLPPMQRFELLDSGSENEIEKEEALIKSIERSIFQVQSETPTSDSGYTVINYFLHFIVINIQYK